MIESEKSGEKKDLFPRDFLPIWAKLVLDMSDEAERKNRVAQSS